MRFIPVYSPRLTPEDAESVRATVESGFVSSVAPVLSAFETKWAERCQMPHAVAVSSGTAALELAVAALALGPGDQVLCPALTIISCVRAIVLAGAEPVLVDADPETWCLDVEDAARRVTGRTRAVLGVHLFGNPYDHAALGALARSHDLRVIEDAAQAHGASVDAGGVRLPCGGLGDVACLSFYANKAVTTGEGGMVLLRDAACAARVRDLSNLCFGIEQRFLHSELGHNYRMSALQAALGLSQLERLEETLARKRRLAESYREKLAPIEEWMPQKIRPGMKPGYWMIAGVLDSRVRGDASELSLLLRDRGVETRPFFFGMHEQPALLERGLFQNERFPVTERLSRRGLYLPSGLDLDEEAVDYVVQAVRESILALGRRARSVPSVPDRQPSDIAARQEPFGELYSAAYDAFYADKDYAGEIATVNRCFERFAAGPVGRVLDLGCGTGRHALELCKLGFQVTGVDRSLGMLEVARIRAKEARFIEGDVRSAELGNTFDAVLMMFGVLSYQTTVDDILSALSTARRHLAPGGLLIADVWFGASAAGAPRRTRRVAKTEGATWVRTGVLNRDPVEQRVEVRYELRRLEGEEEQVTEETHLMHYFHRFELEFALRQCGFAFVRMGTYQDVDRAPGRDESSGLFVARAS